MRTALTNRASLYQQIRLFFQQRNVLEVETPLLSHYGVTDCHIENIEATLHTSDSPETGYLQTSPEYAMKRLLAQNSGDIFQITKAFRDGECGKKHNPEFSLLEWYRVGFTHIELMQEVDELLQLILKTQPATKLSYQNCFQQYIGIDPLNTHLETLKAVLNKHHIHVNQRTLTDIDCLDLLMTHVIEPQFSNEKPVLLYNYPQNQAALAKISNGVAERFEVYYKGIELANGFHELTNVDEQRARFMQDNKKRQQLGLTSKPIDPHLLDALEAGLPNCAGVALGLDRLLMLRAGTSDIKDVLSFDWQNA